MDIVTNIKRADSGTFLSDHFPLSFSLNAECASVCPSFSSKPQKNNSFVCDWAKLLQMILRDINVLLLTRYNAYLVRLSYVVILTALNT